MLYTTLKLVHSSLRLELTPPLVWGPTPGFRARAFPSRRLRESSRQARLFNQFTEDFGDFSRVQEHVILCELFLAIVAVGFNISYASGSPEHHRQSGRVERLDAPEREQLTLRIRAARAIGPWFLLMAIGSGFTPRRSGNRLRRSSSWGAVLGGVLAILSVGILYLMVFKPTL